MRIRNREAQDLLGHLPVRKKNANKSHGGRLWIIAGSGRFPGAAILASAAAARIGAGYVGLSMLGGDKSAEPFWVKAPDLIALPATTKTLTEFTPSAVAIGPGIGRSRTAQETARKILRRLEKQTETLVVVDADGLRALGRAPLPPHWILTPHSGELAHLLGWPVGKVDGDREAAVEMAQQKFGCIVVLKGHGTLIASAFVAKRASKRSSPWRSTVFRNSTGNSALAKAGTGDVLTGIIAGLLAQKVEPLYAARLGVWLHGELADRWVNSGRDQLSLMASDLLADLPLALAEARAAKSRAVGSRAVGSR